MVTTKIGDQKITHTGQDGDPIAMGKSDMHSVTLHLDTSHAPVMKATITRRLDGYTVCLSIAPEDVTRLFDDVREREPVGLTQPHLASTLCEWLDAGLYVVTEKAA